MPVEDNKLMASKDKCKIVIKSKCKQNINERCNFCSCKRKKTWKNSVFLDYFFRFLTFLSQLQKFSLELGRSATNLIFHLVVTL